MIVDEIDNEVGEPMVVPFSFEEFTEKAKALLSEMVSKYLERHECLVLTETLREESQSQILNVIVCHVNVDQRGVDRDRLSDCLGSVVCALVIR